MPLNHKIRELDELAALLKKLKSKGKKIVHSHGVFDLLHVGHIRHFEEAKMMGDTLVVTVTRDEHVNKGPHRPAFPQDLRAEALAALDAVDYVAINRWPLAVETIKLLQPDIYVKGPDYMAADEDITGGITPEAEAVRAVGGEFRATDDITFSSSSLLNRHLAAFPTKVQHYLDDFRKRHSVDEVLSWLERASALRPVVVGEAIIDEYVFCVGIGKSTKDPVLAALQQSVEAYAGGSLAIANHLAGLCTEVGLVTQLGDTDRRENFVRDTLRSNIEPTLLTKSGAPTIQKRRIVDRHSGNKLLEIYVMRDDPASAADVRALCLTLENSLNRKDIVVVADYGHGMLTRQSIGLLCDEAPYLALNVQSNAGNRGFNPISKYRRADYVCLAEHEVAIDTRQRSGSVHDRLIDVLRRIDCPRFTVTRGRSGSLHYGPASEFSEVPAFAVRVLDRVGAGDAVLAVTSLFAKLGAPWDVLGFVGNIAGALMVSELGNSKPLDRVTLSKSIVSLMK
ncbi:MAG TPA: PfkB family carbohydrate kinase [Anaerolineales bacterium]|nr:PfkB family carbohydrate kinase [Anaerolineales bacterium]